MGLDGLSVSSGSGIAAEKVDVGPAGDADGGVALVGAGACVRCDMGAVVGGAVGTAVCAGAGARTASGVAGAAVVNFLWPFIGLRVL